MRRPSKTIAVTAAIAISTLATAAVRADDDSMPTDTRFYVAPSYTYVFANSDRNTKNGTGGTLELGKRISDNLELAVMGFYTKYSLDSGHQAEFVRDALAAGVTPTGIPTSARVYGGGIGANYFPVGDDQGSLFAPLFFHADLMGGFNHEQPGTTNDGTAYKNMSLVSDVGLGYDVSLDPLIGKFIKGSAVRLQALYRIDHRARGPIGPDAGSRTLGEPVLSVGVRVPIGKAPVPPPPPPPPPVKVVPVEQPPPPPPPPPPPCKAPAPGQPIDLDGCKAGDKIVLNGVTFNFNKSTLTPNARTILDQVADALNSHKSMQVELDGYTDSIGSEKYNQGLSQRRADSVKKYLATRGVDASRMTTKGFGESNPVATNKTSEGRALNRRTELKVVAD